MYVPSTHGGTVFACVVDDGEEGRAGGIEYRGHRSGMGVRNGIGRSVGGMVGGEVVRSR